MAEFTWQAELKKEFLAGKPTATAHSNESVLRLVDEYEYACGKSIYDLAMVQRDEMIAMTFKNSSVGTISKNISIISKYIDFCIQKGQVGHHENRFALFTKQDARRFVNRQAVKNKYLSRKQVKAYMDKLYNNQDKLLLWLPFIGVRGRTEEGATLEEIINLQWDPDSEDVKKNILTLEKNNGEIRQLQVDDFSMKLIRDTYQDREYIGNNGEGTRNRRMSIKKNYVNPYENYVFRSPGKNKQEKLTPNLINSRMHRIQKYIGNKYLTITSLYESGMLQMAKEILEQKDSLDKLDYIHICSRFSYGKKPEQYWQNVKNLVKQYREVVKTDLE